MKIQSRISIRRCIVIGRYINISRRWKRIARHRRLPKKPTIVWSFFLIFFQKNPISSFLPLSNMIQRYNVWFSILIVKKKIKGLTWYMTKCPLNSCSKRKNPIWLLARVKSYLYSFWKKKKIKQTFDIENAIPSLLLSLSIQDERIKTNERIKKRKDDVFFFFLKPTRRISSGCVDDNSNYSSLFCLKNCLHHLNQITGRWTSFPRKKRYFIRTMHWTWSKTIIAHLSVCSFWFIHNILIHADLSV